MKPHEIVRSVVIFAVIVVLFWLWDRPTTAQGDTLLRAGDRRGNRVYNGKYWVDAVAEAPPGTQQTRQWDITGGGLASMTVTVIDTTGVCVYLYRGYGIAAMPKTQLRPGQGCQ